MDTDTARTAAENWIDRSAVFQAAAAAEPPQRFTVGDVIRLTNGAYHVSLAPRGYIVVSGDDRIAPILCFRHDGDLNLAASPQNVLRDLLFEDLAVSYQTLNDLAVRNGCGVDAERLSHLLDGMPVVAIDGRTGNGGKALADKLNVPLLAQLPLSLPIRVAMDAGQGAALHSKETAIADLYQQAAWQVALKVADMGRDFSGRFPKIVVE